jgi:hypothetical protein
MTRYLTAGVVALAALLWNVVPTHGAPDKLTPLNDVRVLRDRFNKAAHVPRLVLFMSPV